MIKKYTNDELLDILRNFYKLYKRPPLTTEMRNKNGYPDIETFKKHFGTWKDALIKAGINPTLRCKYSKQILIEYLYKYVEIYDKYPTNLEINKNKDFPNANVYTRYFGSFNNALNEAGFKIKKHRREKIDTECSVCGVTKTCDWYIQDDNTIVCAKCHDDRHYYRGTSNPRSATSIGIITEHIVAIVLNDCVKCNTIDTFNFKYDLISKKYGTINVKSSILKHRSINYMNWQFNKGENQIIPDYYICIGFNEDRTEIQHIWIIPGDSKLVAIHGITISTNQLQRAEQYEINVIPYNKLYKDLDIYSLTAFKNLPRENITSTVISFKQEGC